MSTKGPTAIEPGKRILVTGANGYIGSHVVDLLLSLNYLVRGTVRTDRPWLNQFFESKYGPGKFETVTILKLDDQEALLEALRDVSGIIHVASDVSMAPNASEIIPYAVSLTETILTVAARASVSRVVFTSSSAAAYMTQPGVEGIVVTKDTWNDAAVKAAWGKNTPAAFQGFMTYMASKTESERAAWRWIERNKPKFAFNTVLPNFTLGQNLHPQIAGSTMKWTSELLEGNDSIMKLVPPQHYVDVGDVARMHVIALLEPTVQSERLFAMAYPFTWNAVVNILRELRPFSKGLVSPPTNELEDLSNVLPLKRAKALLKSFFGQSDWTGLKDSLEAGVTSLGL